jgi:NAD dependent epimerase/dehydratase family enzyme
MNFVASGVDVDKSRRVVPGRLLEHGFRFEHPDWPAAARELCEDWRSAQGAEKGDG